MHKDDRIFAIVGAGVGTAVATVAALMWLGSGITVDEPQRAAVVVPLREAVAPETSAVQVTVAGPSESRENSENEAVRRAVAASKASSSRAIRRTCSKACSAERPGAGVVRHARARGPTSRIA